MNSQDIEKAFSDKVEYRFCSWKPQVGMRAPTVSEIKARLLALVDDSNKPFKMGSGSMPVIVYAKSHGEASEILRERIETGQNPTPAPKLGG